MSDQPQPTARDTQFLASARLMIDSLMENQSIDNRQKQETIVSQFLYDFACHVLESSDIRERAYDFTRMYTNKHIPGINVEQAFRTHVIIKKIPDLTTFPPEQEG